MRGRKASLLPLEESLLRAADRLRRGGEHEFYGYLVAKEMQDAENRLMLPSHGSIYKVLTRLEANGLLESRWEDGAIAQSEGRPARRLYQLTALGEKAADAVANGYAVKLPDHGVVV